MNCDKCDKCGKELKLYRPGVGAGYGILTMHGKEERHCYECCAENDREYMRAEGIINLYFYKRGETQEYEVSNWAGNLRFPVHSLTCGKHNIAGVQYRFRFEFEGETWGGVTTGRGSQIARCKRLSKNTKGVL